MIPVEFHRGLHLPEADLWLDPRDSRPLAFVSHAHGDHFQRHTIAKKRRKHLVEPNLIIEIAFDSTQPSKRHDSGLALRFPRIKSIRRDKGIDDIDTLRSAQALLA